MITLAVVLSVANTIVLPMWLLMVILPKWKATRFLIDFKVIPLGEIASLKIGGEHNLFTKAFKMNEGYPKFFFRLALSGSIYLIKFSTLP